MHVIAARNVQEALPTGAAYLLAAGEREPSRDGPVVVAPGPVTTVYERPWERVLLDPVRDANPFFHLMESVWMLAGRRDPVWLDRYVRNFSARYGEESGEQHGAYGHRWRGHFVRVTSESGPGFDRTVSWMDQLTEVADMLRRDPTTRRAVLAMWDPTEDLGTTKRDIPCNTHVYFRSRHVAGSGQDHSEPARYVLDITVLCRSNDIVMGAYGANAVHMSIMGEVVAGLAGMRLGTYRQVSNNFHIYERDLGKIHDGPFQNLYEDESVTAQLICGEDDAPDALREEATRVLSDCHSFVSSVSRGTFKELSGYAKSRWFRETVVPMQLAHDLWRAGTRVVAMNQLEDKMSARSDWVRAGVEWMQRRMRA